MAEKAAPPRKEEFSSWFLRWAAAPQALWGFRKRCRTQPPWDGEELGYFTGQGETALCTEDLAPVLEHVLRRREGDRAA